MRCIIIRFPDSPAEAGSVTVLYQGWAKRIYGVPLFVSEVMINSYLEPLPEAWGSSLHGRFRVEIKKRVFSS